MYMQKQQSGYVHIYYIGYLYNRWVVFTFFCFIYEVDVWSDENKK